MTGHSRAFAQKLPKAHATEIRRQTVAGVKEDASEILELRVPGYLQAISSSGSYLPNPQRPTSCGGDVSDGLGNSNILECDEHSAAAFRANESQLPDITSVPSLHEFPSDDICVRVVPRKIRTLQHILPPEPLNTLDGFVKMCIGCFISDWIVVERKFQKFSSSFTPCFIHDDDQKKIHEFNKLKKHFFEIDTHSSITPPISPSTSKITQGSNQLNVESSRGSWASFDLINCESDPRLDGLLDNVSIQIHDDRNMRCRRKLRPNSFFDLLPFKTDIKEERAERRLQALLPSENIHHRILVQCHKLELCIMVEPIFASIALYDSRERKKVSENFYFDLNPEQLRRMLDTHTKQVEYTTLARSCIFNISSSANSSDLFFVIKLEKVLQGDINDAAEPYLKEMNIDKVRANAYDACNRLGKYRMPFAWTAIWLQNIIKGKSSSSSSSNTLPAGADHPSVSFNEISTGPSCSLDRRPSMNSVDGVSRKHQTQMSLKKNAAGTLSDAMTDVVSLRKGSQLEKGCFRSDQNKFGWNSKDLADSSDLSSQQPLDSFSPVTLTVSSFFKQEGDRLKDDDLYKFLQDLKRSSPVLKRLKCIRGTLKLDISVAADKTKCCLTPELIQLNPFPDMKGRPTKEILEFSPRDVLVPNYHYRNILFVCPKELNFTNRSGERARNIAIKIQLMAGESDDNHSAALNAIFGKSSGPEVTSEVYTAVTYHNKYPYFYEEIKIKLPSNLREYHHIMFTFYHISCQGQRKEQYSTEIPVGYTWLPIYLNGCLQSGVFELPVMIDAPPPGYAMTSPEAHTGPFGAAKFWVDGKKPIFVFEMLTNSSVYTTDKYLDRFLKISAATFLIDVKKDKKDDSTFLHTQQENSYVQYTNEEIISCLKDLSKVQLALLVEFLPLVLDNLILFLSIAFNVNRLVGQVPVDSAPSTRHSFKQDQYDECLGEVDEAKRARIMSNRVY